MSVIESMRRKSIGQKKKPKPKTLMKTNLIIFGCIALVLNGVAAVTVGIRTPRPVPPAYRHQTVPGLNQSPYYKQFNWGISNKVIRPK